MAAGKEIQAKVSELQGQIDSLGRPPPAGPGGVVVDPQSTRRSSLLEQQALFKQRLDQLEVNTALKTGGAEVVTAATPPGTPVKPTPIRTGLVAAIVGLVFGIALAFVFEYLDDTIKGKDDLERATPGLPAVGLIPAVPGWKERKRPILVSASDPRSVAAEAYRSLRTSIQFMGLDRPCEPFR